MRELREAVRRVRLEAGHALLTGAGFLTEPDVLPAQGKARVGVLTGHFYAPQLDNPVNQRFVKEFGEKFKGRCPTASPARVTTPPR